MPFVPVPRRNPETGRCEVQRSVRDSLGIPRTIQVVTVVNGAARAQTKHLTRRKRSKESSFAGNTRRVGPIENETNIEEGKLRGATGTTTPILDAPVTFIPGFLAPEIADKQTRDIARGTPLGAPYQLDVPIPRMEVWVKLLQS
jgi:hypothetical protein